MAIELGTAYIQIQPSTKGLVPNIKKALDKDLPSTSGKAGEVAGVSMSDGMSKSVKGGLPKMGGMLKAGLIGAAAGIGVAFVKGFMDSVDAASSVEQSRGGLAAVFGKDADEMEKHAKRAAHTVGMSEHQYNESATKTGAILKGQGLDYVKWTEDLMVRGADMAATFGTTSQEASDALNAGIRGEYEQLEKYGVSIKESTVNMELVKRGQDKLTGADLERAKAQARLDLIMESTAVTQGQFASESDTMAGKQERLAATFENVKVTIGEKLMPIFSAAMDFIADEVIPGVEGLISAWENSEGVMGSVRSFIETVLIPVFQSFGDFLKNYVGPAISWLFNDVLGPLLDGAVSLVENWGDAWARVWHDIQSAAAVPVNFVIGTIWNNGLRKVFNLLPFLDDLPPAPLISIPPMAGKPGSRSTSSKEISAFARGGILPGFSHASDGDDQLIMARRGEGIVVSEALDEYEKMRLLAMNKAALSGVSPAQFRESYDGHYATGGIVGFRGHKFTDTFVDTLKAAEALAKTTFRISQGGFRPRTSYSGTSHQGDAVDLTPVTGAVVRALRMAGVAAWDRTGKGDWAPHVHGVPLPGYGRGAGSAVWQAQEYLRGRDGLGGRDNGPKVGVNRAATSLGPYADDGNGGNLLDVLPKVWKSAADGMKELSGPWGDMLKSSLTGLLSDAFDWVVKNVPGLKEVMDFFGNRVGKLTTSEDRKGPPNMRGYAAGTTSAAPGPAWVGENGPEIVNFRGGERVYTAEQSAALASPIHIENINLPGIHTFRELAEFVEELPESRRHGHMIGA